MKRIIMLLTVGTVVLATAVPAQAGEESSTDTASTPTTEVPETVTTPTTTTTTPTTTTTVPETVTTTDVPVVTTGAEVDGACVVDCIPEDEAPVVDECFTADCIPASAGGIAPVAVGAGSALPFTGIEDVLAPLLLAIVIGLGGIVAWRWATVREAVAYAATRRGRTSGYTPKSGYAGATKQLAFEQRAAEVFSARVA